MREKIEGLRVRDLHVKIESKIIIEKASFEVLPGEMCALIGPNGAGKSTLLKGTSSLNVKTKGEVSLKGVDVLANSVAWRARKIAYMGQFLEVPSMSVLEVLEMGRRPFSGARLKADDLVLVERSLKKFNLEAWAHKPIASLSGGERQKVMIASVLLQEPKLLLLDEPISHLDPKNQCEMLELIKEETEKQRIMTLVVLHDVHHALHYAHSLLTLKNGKISGKYNKKNINSQILSDLYDIEVTLHEIDGHLFVYYGHEHEEKDSDHRHV